jgi:hypothetical protein
LLNIGDKDGHHLKVVMVKPNTNILSFEGGTGTSKDGADVQGLIAKNILILLCDEHGECDVINGNESNLREHHSGRRRGDATKHGRVVYPLC